VAGHAESKHEQGYHCCQGIFHIVLFGVENISLCNYKKSGNICATDKNQ
jgi:hypothetical protein